MAVISGGHRPSRFGSQQRKKRERPTGVDVLATRFEESRDFWSGEILKGADADDWLKVYYERAEHERFPIEDIDRFLEQCDVKLVVVDDGGECDVKLS